VSWAALVVGMACSVIEVVEVVVDCCAASVEGMCRRAKRFLSEVATAWMISGRVTFKDLSFRQASC
jgi:hypothetical protein